MVTTEPFTLTIDGLYRVDTPGKSRVRVVPNPDQHVLAPELLAAMTDAPSPVSPFGTPVTSAAIARARMGANPTAEIFGEVILGQCNYSVDPFLKDLVKSAGPHALTVIAASGLRSCFELSRLLAAAGSRAGAHLPAASGLSLKYGHGNKLCAPGHVVNVATNDGQSVVADMTCHTQANVIIDQELFQQLASQQLASLKKGTLTSQEAVELGTIARRCQKKAPSQQGGHCVSDTLPPALPSTSRNP